MIWTVWTGIICDRATIKEAQAASECHQRACAVCALDTGELTGVFEDWQWWLGSTRTVWLPASEDTVYKIERFSYAFSNENEHENMQGWRRKGLPWAPETWLFRVDCPELTSPIIAMPFYPDPISSPADITESVTARWPMTS